MRSAIYFAKAARLPPDAKETIQALFVSRISQLVVTPPTPPSPMVVSEPALPPNGTSEVAFQPQASPDTPATLFSEVAPASVPYPTGRESKKRRRASRVSDKQGQPELSLNPPEPDRTE